MTDIKYLRFHDHETKTVFFATDSATAIRLMTEGIEADVFRAGEMGTAFYCHADPWLARDMVEDTLVGATLLQVEFVSDNVADLTTGASQQFWQIHNCDDRLGDEDFDLFMIRQGCDAQFDPKTGLLAIYNPVRIRSIEPVVAPELSAEPTLRPAARLFGPAV
jgi:hypothetical protein